MQRSVSAQQTKKAQSIHLSKMALANNLCSMRGLVAGLKRPVSHGTPDERAAKARLKAQQRFRWKPTIAPDYQLDTVRQAFGSMARITHEEVDTTSGRTLFAYSRT